MIKRTTDRWAEWPECPQCHARREARCSVCSARGTDFRLADFEEPEDAEEGGNEADVLLLCSTCDEPFTPQVPPPLRDADDIFAKRGATRILRGSLTVGPPKDHFKTQRRNPLPCMPLFISF